MKKQRYEFISEKSLKFWEVQVDGVLMTTTYGRIGKTAQSTQKAFSESQEATAAARTRIKEKKRKGYIQVPLKPVYRASQKARKEASSNQADKPSGDFIDELDSYGGGYGGENSDRFSEKWCAERKLDWYEVLDAYDDLFDTAVHQPAVQSIWEKYQADSIPDGVAWSDKAVPKELQRRLNYNFTRMLNQEPADFHPGSNRQVRDLVHPSLFPYVKGLSKTNPEKLQGLPVRLHCRKECTNYGWHGHELFDRLDFWKRLYEESRFQWLPTPFEVSKKGKVKIQSYINNLDQAKYPSLYGCLEQLFSLALPLFESVCGYVEGLHLYDDDIDDVYQLDKRKLLKETPAIRLRGRELQVITKMVEYQIDPKKGLEGVWHVEGMSHENILATAVYVLKRDESLAGGEIQFRRSYTLDEAHDTFHAFNGPCAPIADAIEKGIIPNGTLSTPEGRLFVFPNSHIHKLSKMTATGLKGAAKRRVIVFWLVHPDAPIISTREVPPQQKIIGKRKAKEIRLKLMNERKRHKQSLNPRSVSLCEH